MKNSAQRFSATNSWVLDFTFKTNQYGFLFYVVIVPNQDRIIIHVFYMHCSDDMEYAHESIAIKIVLTYIFESLKKIRPSAIVFYKQKTSLNAFQNIINNNIYCWTYDGV